MVNYQDGKLYKIVCNTTGLVYYGSTSEKQLSQRLSHHKGNYKQYLKGKGSFITSFRILEKDNYEIVLVEKLPCNDKMELHQRERFYIDNNECVNKVIPTRTMKEYLKCNEIKIKEQTKIYKENHKPEITEYNKAYLKTYYENNKEDYSQKARIYREENKEKIIEYRIKNKDKLNSKYREKKREYYLLNKDIILKRNKELRDIIKTKITCECGCTFLKGGKNNHLKTLKHLKYLSAL